MLGVCAWTHGNSNSDFYSTHHEINQGSHCENKNRVQVSQQVSLRWKNGEEETTKDEAGQIGDDN